MKKKLLTIEDLISYCENQNLFSLNSKDSGYQICVQIPVQFEEEESDDEDLFVGNIRLLHTGRNNNGSNVTYDAAKNCLSTIPYKPILANFTDVNGEWDFTTHEFEINDDGSITYIEKQVG